MPKRGALGGDPQVAARRELEPAADTKAANRGDHRVPATGDRIQRGMGALGIAARPLDRAAVLSELRNVGADRERPLAGAGDDHAAQRPIGIKLGEHLAQPVPHGVIDGVQLVRPIERDPGDLAVTFQ
jgi:hypothetical protein